MNRTDKIFSTYRKTAYDRMSIVDDRATPVKIALEFQAGAGMVWKRWFWYGPMVLTCILTIFLAGPDDCQNLYMAAKRAPQHRTPDFVESRQDDVLNYQTILQLSYDYREKDYSDLRDRYDASFPTAPDLDQTRSDAANCTEFFLTSLFPQLRRVTATSPQCAKEALRSHRLDGLPSARLLIGRMLTEPVPVAEFVNTVATCTAQNAPLVAWGCELMAQSTTTPRTGGGGYVVGLDDTACLITRMMVLDKLTHAAVTSPAFAKAMVATASRVIEDAGGADALIDADPMIVSHNKQFVKDKHRLIMTSVTSFARTRNIPDSSPGLSARAHEARSMVSENSLRLNLIEAVSTEWDAGLQDNAFVGLALAHHTMSQGDSYTISDSSDDPAKSRRVKWDLGKEWADTYIAWNLAFVTSTVEVQADSVPGIATKLIIPSIICTAAGSSSGLAQDDFIIARTYSLWLRLMSFGNLPSFTSPGATSPAWATGFGESNLQNLGIPAPTKDEINDMMRGFVPEASLWAWVDPGSWRFVQAIMIWGSVLVLGWGGELLSAAVLFAQPTQRDAANSASMGAGDAADADAGDRLGVRHGYWKLAQLTFPLFLTIAIVSRSIFGLPFLCAGLWKFGFPETVTALVAGHLAAIDGKPVTHLEALGSFMTGLGTIFHHNATAWLVVSLVTGIVSKSADPTVILATTVPLILQHWIVQFKYVNFYAYTGLLLVSEIWWEIEVIVHMDKARYWHEQRCLWGMLVSHWLYWLGGLTSYVSARRHDVTARDDDVDGNHDGDGNSGRRRIQPRATVHRMKAVITSASQGSTPQTAATNADLKSQPIAEQRQSSSCSSTLESRSVRTSGRLELGVDSTTNQSGWPRRSAAVSPA